MTPNELLEQAKARIGSVLLVDEDQQLTAFLLSSIRKYRDLAGFCKTMTIRNSGRIDLPNDFLSTSSLKDATEDACFYDVETDANGKFLTLHDDESYPLTLRYFADLLAIDLTNGQLPHEAEEIICEHLTARIKKENTKRLAVIENMGEMDVSHMSAPESFDQTILAIEERMQSQHAFGDILSLQP